MSHGILLFVEQLRANFFSIALGIISSFGSPDGAFVSVGVRTREVVLLSAQDERCCGPRRGKTFLHDLSVFGDHLKHRFLRKQHSFLYTMSSFPRSLGHLVRNDAAWTCSSSAKASRRKPSTPFFQPERSIRRNLSNSSETRQNAAPTMEQLRSPFQRKNSSTLYYTLSIILGTVALSYGSVPMYKMVRSTRHPTSTCT